MSSEYRSVDEYIDLFAKDYGMPEDIALHCAMVQWFKQYAKEREKEEDGQAIS